MNHKFLLPVLVLLATAGCLPAPIVQPTPTSTPTALATPPAPTGAVSGPLMATATPAAPNAALPALEKISAENAGRLAVQARVGEGTFEDHIAVSPDGKLLAVTTGGGVLLVNAVNGQRLAFYPSPAPVESLAFSPDGKRLATIHRPTGEELVTAGPAAGSPVLHPFLTLRDLASGTVIFSIPLAGRGCGQYAAWDLAFAPDGQTLAFRDQYSLLGHDRTENLCLLSAGDGSLLHTITIEPPWQTTAPVLFSPDGRLLVTAVLDRTTEGLAAPATRVRVYDTASGGLAREFDGQGSIHDLALSADGEMLALAGEQGARLLSARDGRLLASFGRHTREVEAVAFSPDGASLALGSLDGTVSLWSVPDGAFRWQTTAWTRDPGLYVGEVEVEIWDLAFSPDGQALFALSPTHVVFGSGRVSALGVDRGQELYNVYGYNDYAQPDLSADGTRAVFGGFEDGRGQVWSVLKNQPLFDLAGHTRMILAAVFSPDGQHIATGSLDGTVRLWQAGDGAPAATLSGNAGAVRAVQFSPDGARLASIGDDAVLQLWDAGDGRLLKSIAMQNGEGPANGIVFSPDGKAALLAFGCPYTNCPGQGKGSLRRVDLASGQIETLVAYAVYHFALSADQGGLATWSQQGIHSGQLSAGRYQDQFTYTSPLGTGALDGTAISPDGALFFSGNGFGLHVWNAASGKMLALCKNFSSSYGEMWVTPDQQRVVISQLDGLVSVWGVPDGS